jgi:hypothetical protein
MEPQLTTSSAESGFDFGPIFAHETEPSQIEVGLVVSEALAGG